MTYRHEYKYIVSNAQLELIKYRIGGLMMKDPHVGSDGYYNIRSLYFDDYYNSCFYDNENGVDPREKYRIRIYNHNLEMLTLECKRKEREKVLKTSCYLTRGQCEKLISGGYLRDIVGQTGVLKKLTVGMMTRNMQPKVIVEYDRIPYVYPYGNVRVTLDMNISSSSRIDGFLDDVVPKRPIMPRGMYLLEVKWDEYLPDVIYRALQLDSLKQTAYSKYYLCRKYRER
jgi:hypothetical protein